MSTSAIIIGQGSYLPEKIVTNYDLEKILDTTNDWIISRTGITQRHIAENQSVCDMAYNAAINALHSCNFNKDHIDLIIVATTTADQVFPSTAVKLQKMLGISGAASFDVQAVCAGFLYGMNISNNFIKSGAAKNILLVGVDKMSNLLDWQDRSTCVLFGDGAGAVIISSSNKNTGIIASKIYSNGEYHDILYTDIAVGKSKSSSVIKMNGQELFKHAVEKMSGAVNEILVENHYDTSDIDVFIPHQANIRILDAVRKKLTIPQEKVICTLDQHANTSAASIPLALDYAICNNKIKSEDLVALTAIGSGLCWGAALIKW